MHKTIRLLARLVVLTALLAVSPTQAAPVGATPQSGTPAVRIIPLPQQLEWQQTKGFSINSWTKIVVNSNADSKDMFTANQLKRKIWDTTGRMLPVVKANNLMSSRNVIAVGDRAKNKVLDAILNTWPQARSKAAKSEGYILAIKDSSIAVCGFDQSGAFYGCQTLIQLFEQQKSGISSLFCYDYPDLAWRGTMVRVRAGLDVDFTKEVVSEIMARFKMNVLELHISYGVLWPSHPELYHDRKEKYSPPTTFPQIKEVADFARQHFIEVIPSGVSWSHSWEWQTAEDMNTDLLESTDPRGGNMCPRNPKGQKLIQDLIQDQIDTFNPRYIHMGWDEIGDIGVCQYCKGEDPAELFTDYLKRDRDYLAARGIKTIIWADMFRTDMNGGPPWNLHRTLKTMPKDIIVSDWYYTGHHKDFPTLKTWNDNGLQSLAVPYGVYPPGIENIYSWCQAAKRHNILGVVAFNKYTCGTKKNVFANQNALNELSCYAFIGEWGWTPDKPDFNPAPYERIELSKSQVSPQVPTDLKVSSVDGKVTLTWTNPPEKTFQATWICYRKDRYPKNPLDGTFVCDAAGAPESQGSFIHTEAPQKGKIYYAAFSHDGIRRFSVATTATLDR